MPTTLKVRSIAIAGCLLVGLVATAQKPDPIPTAVGPLTMNATLGSFKLLGHSDEDPARGKLEVSFTGTMLINGLSDKGHITPSGSIRLEYQNDKHGVKVYFGTGKITVEGQVRAIQCFGKDIVGTFTGRGIFRLTGEFDKNSKTGEYWFGLPTAVKMEKKPWGTYGTQIEVPEVHYGVNPNVVPTPRKGGG